MLLCPRCDVTLGHAEGDAEGLFACPRCKGRATTIPVLHRLVERDVVERLKQTSRYATRRAGSPCPSCRAETGIVPLAVGAATVPVDVCLRCQFVWFDAKELEALPRRALPVGPEPARSRRRAPSGAPDDGPGFGQGPDSTLGWILGLLGMPIEENAPVLPRRPWTTWLLVAVTTLASVVAFQNLPAAISKWAFVPSHAWRENGLTFLTAFLLHGDPLHLFGNMYFLWIFGDDVECLVGVPKFLGLVAASTVAGNALHMLTTGQPDVPCIGASGGISGVIAFYALAFPGVRIGVWRYVWLHMSARTAFIVWLVLQALFAAIGGGNIGYMAHLGGAAMGVVLWFLWRPRVVVAA
jgi:membrane associated rhomboid family serine protease/Zn-finger nucleic acid-binding protein